MCTKHIVQLKNCERKIILAIGAQLKFKLNIFYYESLKFKLIKSNQST